MDWLFLLLLAVAAGAGHYMEALILVGSLAAHEIAHLAAGWVLGIGAQELYLTPLGAMARMDSLLELDPQAETSIALAGPFQSFFLAGLVLALQGGALWDQRLVRYCFEINASLAFFNLIPALPLDGGRALRGLLAQRWGYRRVTGWMASLGRMAGISMSGIALLLLVGRGELYATPLVGGLFLTIHAGREVETALYRTYRQFVHKRSRLSGRGIMAARQLVVVQGTRLGELMTHLASGSYHLVLVVDEAMRPLGTLHEAELMDAFAELGPRVTLEELIHS